MNKKLFVFFSAILILFFISCNKEDDNEDPNENQNTAPVASFIVNPQTGTIETVFNFDASASSV